MKKIYYFAFVLTLSAGLFSSCSKTDDDNGSSGGSTPSSGTYTDSRDGKEYSYVTIGTQKWMTKNFAYEVNGSVVYDNKASNEAQYGRLYTYDQALAAVPSGWRLATDDDWKQLEMHYGMTQTEADKLVQRGTDEGKKIGAGLKLEYAGRSLSGSFMDIDKKAYYWTSTESPSSSSKGIRRTFANFDDHSFRDYEDKGTYYSIRLIKE